MPMQIQIRDPDGLTVTMTVSGKYSPDIVDDLKRRAYDAYKEAFALRVKTLGIREAAEE